MGGSDRDGEGESLIMLHVKWQEGCGSGKGLMTLELEVTEIQLEESVLRISHNCPFLLYGSRSFALSHDVTIQWTAKLCYPCPRHKRISGGHRHGPAHS